MPEHAAARMTPAEFLAWHRGQIGRYELIAGAPVAMAGAKRSHDRVVVNALFAITGQLGSGLCQPFTSDTAVRIPANNIRYPDLGIDCGRFIPEAMEADAPSLVVEVLSESTRVLDFLGKLDDYKSVPSLRSILLIETDAPDILLWRRSESGVWTSQAFHGLEAEIRIDDPRLILPLRALYTGLEFRPRPRLVVEESDAAAG